MKQKLMLFFFLALLGLQAAQAQTADSKRGQSLYEGRCLVCHKDSLFGASGPKARNLDGVRAQVKLWDAVAGGALWSSLDAEDVTSYLNEKFYRY
jgi:mono/diheme cytochrome c family protein